MKASLYLDMPFYTHLELIYNAKECLYSSNT